MRHHEAHQEEAAPELPETLTIELDPPVAHNGLTCASLELREPTASQVKSAEALMKGMTPEAIRNYQIKLVELVAKVPPLVVAQLPIRKLMEAVRYLEGFILAAPATGKS